MQIPRPDVVANLSVLAKAADRVNGVLGPVRLDADGRRNSLQHFIESRAVWQRLDAPAYAHDPVVEVVGHLRLVIDIRLLRPQLRSPYGGRGGDVGHGLHLLASVKALT